MNKIVIPLVLIAFGLSVTSIVLVFNKSPKIGFVNIESVYDGFVMKKQLESKFENVTQMRKQILDSLKLELTILSKSISSEKDVAKITAFQQKRQEYIIKEEGFSESTTEMTEQYKSQIWKQLSQYIAEFSKQNHYKYMLGFENKSSILYGDEGEDVTKELTNYVNEKYNGNTK